MPNTIMGREVAVRAFAKLYIIVSVVGAVHAVRRGRPARFAGLSFPGTPLAHALTVGTPLSAPPPMLLALAAAVRNDRRRPTRLLALLLLVGIMAEPDSWAALRGPTADPQATACTALEVALPIALLVAGRSMSPSPPPA
jgi:hypothetical protein